MRPQPIVEAFADTISCPGAHRSSPPNWIFQEVPLPFGFHSLPSGSVPFNYFLVHLSAVPNHKQGIPRLFPDRKLLDQTVLPVQTELLLHEPDLVRI